MKELLGNIDVVLEDNKNLSSIKEVVYTFKNKKKVVTLLKYKMFPL